MLFEAARGALRARQAEGRRVGRGPLLLEGGTARGGRGILGLHAHVLLRVSTCRGDLCIGARACVRTRDRARLEPVSPSSAYVSEGAPPVALTFPFQGAAARGRGSSSGVN
eukprot:scaffold2831_cov330-Prasinococcus_capsulatus_cf.AAC.4